MRTFTPMYVFSLLTQVFCKFISRFQYYAQCLMCIKKSKESDREHKRCFSVPSAMQYSTDLKSFHPTKVKMIIERKIDTLETVDEQLYFVMEVNYMTVIVNRIAILYNIAKITEKEIPCLDKLLSWLCILRAKFHFKVQTFSS